MKEELKRKAYEILGKRGIDGDSIDARYLDTLVDELGVYHQELQKQNKKLADSQISLDALNKNYSELYGNIPLGLMTIDKNNVIREVNSRASKMLNLSRAELLEKPLLKFVHQEYLADFNSKFRQVIKGSGEGVCELMMVPVNKPQFLARINCIYNDNYENLSVSIENIAEDNKSNKLIDENGERLRLALNGATDGVWDRDLNTNELFLSENWKKMLGYKDEELENSLQTFRELIHPDDLPKSLKYMNDHVEGKKDKYSVEFRMKHKAGHWVHILSRGVALWKENEQKPYRFIGTHTDISERIKFEDEIKKKNRELLKQNEAIRLANRQLKSLNAEIFSEKSKTRHYLDISGVLFIALNKDGIVTLANKKTSEVLGYPEDEIIGKNWFENFLPESDIERVEEVFDKIINGKLYEVKFVEGQVITKEKEVRTIKWHNSILTDEMGQISGILSSGEDITKSKIAESELLKLNHAIDQSTSTIVITDTNGNIEFTNPAFEKSSGYSLAEAIGKNPNIVKSGLQTDEYYKGLWETISSGKNWTGEFNNKKKNGDLYWESAVISPVKDEENNITHYIAIKKDITKEKNVEENLIKALKESKQKEKEISELLNATNSILKKDDFNETARAIFDACARTIDAHSGYVILCSEKTDKNRIILHKSNGRERIVDQEFNMPIDSFQRQAFDTGKVVYINNFMHSKSAEQIPKEYLEMSNVLFSPVTIDGITVGMMGFSSKEGGFNENDARIAKAFGDYAAIALQNSRAMEKLDNRAKELQELNNTKDKLLSIIGHDLKNPIFRVLGFAELLKDEFDHTPEEEIRLYHKIIYDSTKSISIVLENLLKWSSLQRERTFLNRKNINLNELTEMSINLLSASANGKQIQVNNNIPKKLYVYADEEMLSVVIRNLLSNAIKFTDRSGIVEIDGKVNRENIMIIVKDNGMGMSEDVLAKLFSVDEKVTSKGTAGEKGSGLGLIISKEFVELNQGKIWVESIEGEGSTFFVELPDK